MAMLYDSLSPFLLCVGGGGLCPSSKTVKGQRSFCSVCGRISFS